MLSLAGKTALVTGGGSGIGRAVVVRFAERGAELVVLDISAAAAAESAELARAAGAVASAVECDVSDAAAVDAAFGALAAQGKTVDVLVNSAGISHIGTLESTDEASFDRLYRVNVKGTYLCCRAARASMPAHGGVIVNMASI